MSDTQRQRVTLPVRKLARVTFARHTNYIIGGMIADPTEQRWMRVEEAAVYARVGIAYVRKLIRTRRLPAIDTGRY